MDTESNCLRCGVEIGPCHAIVSQDGKVICDKCIGKEKFYMSGFHVVKSEPVNSYGDVDCGFLIFVYVLIVVLFFSVMLNWYLLMK